VTPRRTGYPFLDEAGPVLAFAHRGGAGLLGNAGLENTHVAFASAVALGYRYLETDVHVTRDGVLVAFHDEVLDRMTDGTGAVADVTSAELARVRIEGRERVPTLAELVTAFPLARFNIDLKTELAVAPLAAFVAEHELHERVLVGAFSRRRLAAFRRLAGPRVATSAHPGEVAAYVLLPSRLAQAVTRGRPVALQLPHRLGPLTLASARVVRRAHAAGLQVHVWTIDDPDEMRLLLDRGVDGLITDRTDILKEVLCERGQWRTD
jgi:glycerophosphoryl diester phosphodiesterase